METKKGKGLLAGCYCAGTVCDCEHYQSLSNKKILELPCDVLVPAAVENQITRANAGRIKATIILEMANGPVAVEADEKLKKRGILVIPDVLANAGGVTASYWEWVQNLNGDSWSETKVLDNTKEKLVKALDASWQIQKEKGVTLRVAAYIVALRRIAESIKGRGWV